MFGISRIKLSIMSVFLVLLTVFLTLILATSVSIISYTYYETSRVFLNSADQQIDMIAKDAIKSTAATLDEAMRLAQSLAWNLGKKSTSVVNDFELEREILGDLSFHKNIAAYFIGEESGNVLNVGRILDMQKQVMEPIPVPEESSYMVRKITRSEKIHAESRAYLTKSGMQLGAENLPSDLVRYDARVRPWYVAVKNSRKSRWTDVYLFENNEIGITATSPIFNEKKVLTGIVAIDLGMAQLSNMLLQLKVGTSGIPIILTERGEIIGHPDVTKTSKRVGDTFVMTNVNEIGQLSLSEAFSMYKKTGKKNFVFNLGEEAYIASFMPFPEGYGSGWLMGVVVPQNDFVGPLKKASEDTILISLAIILLALISVVLFSRRVSGPIRELAEDMRKVENFDIDTSVEIHTKLREIAMVADGLRSMKQGLKSFSRYIPKDLVRQLIASGHSAELGGEKKKLTILFSDIESFTSVSEKMPSEQMLIHLSTYLDHLSQLISQSGGTIDKYIGDSIMAFWGAPMADDKQVYNGCYAILRCLREVNDLNYQWRQQSLPLLPTRFGLNTAEVIVGNMGSSERLNYTIIGDGVNLASRLEGLNKEYGTYALVSHAIYKEAKDEFVFRPLDVVAVKGKTEGIVVYELCGMHSGEFRCDERDLERYKLFFEAFELYRQRQWAKALKIYKALAKDVPTDKVTQIYIDRCTLYAKTPPPEDWDGVYRLHHK